MALIMARPLACYPGRCRPPSRVRVVSPGFERDWHVQFPRGAREEGARYVVDQVLPSARGGFYRALGNIQKLVT